MSLRTQIRRAVEKERERCARACDDYAAQVKRLANDVGEVLDDGEEGYDDENPMVAAYETSTTLARNIRRGPVKAKASPGPKQ
ncbi:MAG: hypothetical protein ACHREM_08905 [Polyangiales bacterium]